MPDLIYNVKFEIDKASAEKVGQIVDTSNTQDVKVLQKEVDQLNQVLKESSVENGKVSNSVKQKILAYKEEVANLKLLDTKINKSIRVYGEFSEETGALVTGLQRQSEAVDRTGGELLELANTSDRTTGEIVALTNAVSTGNRAMVAGARRSREMSMAQRAMGGQLGSTNKTFAAGNQAVFSFSDLIQDSTQFSYGFAQGMRAIGNNIGFTAELLAVMSAQAKESGQSLGGSLLASLKGVNGVVLGINVAVTIATVLLQKFGSTAKEAATEIEDLLSATTKLRESVSGDSFSFMNETQLRSEIESINSLKPVLDEISAAQAKYTEQLNLELKSLQFLERQSPKYKEELEELEKKYGITTEEVESLNERLKTNQNRLDTISAQKAITPLALLEEQVLFLNNSFRDLFDTTGQFKDLEAGAQVFFELAAASEENSQAQLKYLKAGREIQEQIKKEKSERQSLVEMQRKAAKEVSELNEQALSGGEDPVSRLANIYSKELQMTREQNAKKAALAKEFLDERQRLDLLYFNKQREAEQREADRSFNQAMTLRDLIGQEEILRADQKTATLLSIDNKYQNLKLQLGAQGLLNKDINDQLEILSEEEKAQALISINRQEKMAKLDMATQATQALSGLGQSLFGESKELAIAETLISTYFAAQKAYESQFLPVPTPDSPARGGIAAAIAVAQGLARVAAIKSTNIGSGGGASGGTRSIGVGANTRFLPTAQQSEEESFRAFGESVNFTPNSPSFKLSENIIVEQNVKGKDLALVVRAGNKELKSSQVIG